MTLTEDDLASALVDYYKQSTKKTEKIENTKIELNIYPEAHYNHYGERGSVDLFVEQNYSPTYIDGKVIELKSESAVREATGANEIIRQFNKMRENFFRGSSHDYPTEISFELCFTPNKYNIRYLSNNIGLYQSTIDNKLIDKDPNNLNRIVTTRPDNPDNIMPIIFCSPNVGILKDNAFHYLSYIRETQEDLYNNYKSIFEDIEERHIN